jgi:hypothetical protein
MKAYLRALQQRRFIRAAIAHVAKLRRDQPDQEAICPAPCRDGCARRRWTA